MDEGTLSIALRLIERAGYELAPERKVAICNGARRTYLEHLLILAGWQVETRMKDATPKVERETVVKIDKEAVMRELAIRKARARQRMRMIEQAKQNVRLSSSTKVVHYNLGTCPMTEREQAMIDYFLVAWR